jgi:hypothetical protein
MEGIMKSCDECMMGSLLTAGKMSSVGIAYSPMYATARAAIDSELKCLAEVAPDISKPDLANVGIAITNAFNAGYIMRGVENGLLTVLGRDTVKQLAETLA